MIYFQVQYQNTEGKWLPYLEAYPTMQGARLAYVDMVNGYQGNQRTAVRIVSVWKLWDNTWTVKEVLEYRTLGKG